MRVMRVATGIVLLFTSAVACHDVSEIDKPVVDAGCSGMMCDGVCRTDTATNVNYCGNCTTVCLAPENALPPTCAAGSCSFKCAPNYLLQNDQCVPVPFSCTGLAEKCGPNGDDNCCQYDTVDDLTPLHGPVSFARGYDATESPMVGTDTLEGVGWEGPTDAPASVDSFTLDRYEVTIGRFRAFLANYDTLLNSDGIPAGAGGYKAVVGSGWQTSWNDNDGELGTGHPVKLFASSEQDLRSLIAIGDPDAGVAPCSPTDPNPTTTDPNNPTNATILEWLDDAAGANDQKPMSCVSWYEAFMFCYKDNARLPTEAEWHAAASGADLQRAFAWSDPPDSIDLSTDTANLSSSGVEDVGSNGKRTSYYGPFDLTGNVIEFVYDSVADISQYELSAGTSNPLVLDLGANRVVRGGSYKSDQLSGRVVFRTAIADGSNGRFKDTGWRCARPAAIVGSP